MQKAILYSTPTCPYCQKLKEFLDENGVTYEEKNVARDEQAAHEMIDKSGQTGVPVLDLDGQIVVGYDEEKIAVLLGR